VSELIETKNIVREVNASARAWPDGEQPPYRVDCLAPTQFDQNELDRLLERAFDIAGDRVTVADAFQARLLGLVPPGDVPNQLSLALSVRWDQFRFLLAGDVENGTGSPFSGWPGVLELLAQEGRRDLVTGLTLVKVAHHGSTGAFLPDAWNLHAQGREEGLVALLAPFNKGRVQLPDLGCLSELRDRASYVGITAAAGNAFSRASNAGLRRLQGAAQPRGPVLAAVFGSDGRLVLHAGDMAALFQPTPKRAAYDDLVSDDDPFS
jgi:hypothetical protein